MLGTLAGKARPAGGDRQAPLLLGLALVLFALVPHPLSGLGLGRAWNEFEWFGG